MQAPKLKANHENIHRIVFRMRGTDAYRAAGHGNDGIHPHCLARGMLRGPSRRQLLEHLVEQVNHPGLRLSPRLSFGSWQSLTTERQSSKWRRPEGLMLKRRSSSYRSGRVRGDWRKWKVEPFTVDAVHTAAQPGHGKRSGLYTDYTFGVWENVKLISIAKPYSGLTDAEIRQVDAFFRGNTLERFGPAPMVRPALVFEIGFEGIRRSSRHKSGIAVRFPRILRWRTDKQPAESDPLERVRSLLLNNSQKSRNQSRSIKLWRGKVAAPTLAPTLRSSLAGEPFAQQVSGGKGEKVIAGE